MWCSEPASRRTALAALAATALAACGFTPLYDPAAPAARMLGRVEVGLVEGEPGFALRERLTQRLGPPTDPAYRLEVTLELDRTGVALTQQNITTRFNVTGTAEYRLVPLDGGPPASSGIVRSITGFSAPESETASAFASLSAERDAELRVANDLAERILQRLALDAEALV